MLKSLVMHPSNDKTRTRPRRRRRSKPKPGLALRVLPETFGICRLEPKNRIPGWIHRSAFYSVSRSSDELSIVCEERCIPKRVERESDWRAIRVIETLDFSLIGVLASLAKPMTDAGVSIFSLSTFDTDYLLVRGKNLTKAVEALEAAGHQFPEEQPDTQSETTAETQPEKRPARRSESRRSRPQAEETDEKTVDDGQSARDAGDSQADGSDDEARPRRRRRRRRPRRSSSTETDARSEETRGAESRPASSWRRPPSESEPSESASSQPRASEDEELDLDWESATDPMPTAARGAATVRFDQLDLGTATPETVTPEVVTPEAITPATVDAETVDTETVDTETVDTETVGLDISGDGIAHPAGDEADPALEDEATTLRVEGLFTGAIPVELTDESFEKLGLSPAMIDTLDTLGFKNPTPIQAAVIPDALEGADIIGLAETGSGKTAAFSLPLAEKLHHGRGIRGLILCPTREIALQTRSFLQTLGRNHDLETLAVIGGVKMGPQISGLKGKPDILVATPGRLADHLRRGNVRLDQLEELVLDEADHMLDLGFLPQIKEILEQVPEKRRTMMFSATMPPPIARLAQLFMDDPKRVDIRPEGQVAEGIEHRLYLVREEDMKPCVISLLGDVEGSTLIFVRRKLYTEWLARQLELAGHPVERIHSDRTQAQRVQALRGFREGKVRILVATDVAARGIDIPRIQHVINYGPPEMVEDYVHRAGRTARGNSVGIVSTIATWKDKIMIRDIERTLDVSIPRREAPGVEPWTELRRRKTVRRRRLL